MTDMGLEISEFEVYLNETLGHERESFRRKAVSGLIRAGGKRIRPAMAIAAGTAGNGYNRNRVYQVACAIELIHTASLVHDDVVDASPLRRGAPTLNFSFGAHAAVLTGDWLLTQALVLLADARLDQSHLRELAKAVRAMCGGELEQYQNRRRAVTVSEYLRRAMRKTGILFACACALGGAAGGAGTSAIRQLFGLGLNFGVAYQISDDIDDILSTDDQKPRGADIVSGTLTLPVIYAAQAGFDIELCDNISEQILSYGGIERSRSVLRTYLKRADTRLGKLGPFPGKGLFSEQIDSILIRNR